MLQRTSSPFLALTTGFEASILILPPLQGQVAPVRVNYKNFCNTPNAEPSTQTNIHKNHNNEKFRHA